MSTYGEAMFVNYVPMPVAFVRGEGSWLEDANGKRYLDFLAGIAVTTLGHGHPRLSRALAEQAARYLHVSNLFRIPESDEASRALIGAAHEGAAEKHRLERVFFCNSGAEANEALIKLVRKHAWRAHEEAQKSGEAPYEILVTDDAFHGRTYGALAATGTPKYRVGFGPMPGGFKHVPFGDLEAARAAVSEKTCAVLIEPVQGEGGVHPGSPEYLHGLEALCRENDLLFALDEVQTGIGRTGGHWFAFQQMGLAPDVVSLAKGLGGGVPVGAVLATDRAARALQPGDHGSTFGGNPLACRAVTTVLEVIREEGLLEKATERGTRLEDALLDLASPHILEVRGPGLMKAFETDLAAPAVAAACLDRGLIVNAVRPTSVRLLPPLVVTDEEVDQAVSIIGQALAEVSAEGTTEAAS